MRDEPLPVCALVVANDGRELSPTGARIQDVLEIPRKLLLHDGATEVNARAGYHVAAAKGGRLACDVVADFTERTDATSSVAHFLHTSVAPSEPIRITAQDGGVETAWGQLLRR